MNFSPTFTKKEKLIAVSSYITKQANFFQVLGKTRDRISIITLYKLNSSMFSHKKSFKSSFVSEKITELLKFYTAHSFEFKS